jgi:hypothetical protein
VEPETPEESAVRWAAHWMMQEMNSRADTKGFLQSIPESHSDTETFQGWPINSTGDYLAAVSEIERLS